MIDFEMFARCVSGLFITVLFYSSLYINVKRENIEEAKSGYEKTARPSASCLADGRAVHVWLLGCVALLPQAHDLAAGGVEDQSLVAVDLVGLGLVEGAEDGGFGLAVGACGHAC